MNASKESLFAAFSPSLRPQVSIGLPFDVACAHHIPNTFKASKVYVIVSNSIYKTHNHRKLEEALPGKIVGTRRGIRQHTPWDDVIEIAQDVRDRNADIIVTLGAGSLIDGAKVISLAVANVAYTLDGLAALAVDAKPQNVKPCTIPIINIPTSLSGGEYSVNAGATDLRTHRKHSFNQPSMGCELIILDPELSVSTPEHVWLQSGVRALDHCVEALCSLSPNVTAESDAAAIKGLRLLAPSLLMTKKDPHNLDARRNEMLGVIEAMKPSRAKVAMGASHGIGHQLGPLGVGHGETSCVMLPAVLKYNWQQGDAKVRERQDKVLEILCGEAAVVKMLSNRGLKEADTDAGTVVGALISELGMPRSLKDVGVGAEQLDKLAENSMHDRWIPTNPVPLKDKDQVLEVLKMALTQ
ncbi:MAG: hypothetical protein M1822_007686 [Bathelium mastoideum]|nr:MAG: hypothetical protein M1822_007686 [Bathelium mastoideum]